MKRLEKEIIRIWKEDIKQKFLSGTLVYERQLQAELYSCLKYRLNEDYIVWVEPVMYLEKYDLGKAKPDIVITKKDEIIAINELKFKPWEFPMFKHDIEKLEKFQNVANDGAIIQLGIIPQSPNWNEQKESEKFLKFKIANNFLKIFSVVGHPDSSAINLESIINAKGFLHLFGYFKDDNNINFGYRKF